MELVFPLNKCMEGGTIFWLGIAGVRVWEQGGEGIKSHSVTRPA